MLHSLTSDQYAAAVASNPKLVLYFSSDTCGPCRVLKPLLENLETDLKIFRVDAAVEEELNTQFGVTSVPVLVLISDGAEISRKSGIQSGSAIKTWLGVK